MDIRKIEDSLEKELHVSRWIIGYKFILGFIEIWLGIGVIIYGQRIINLYREFKTKELLENPHDLLITIADKFFPIFIQHRFYIVSFLLLIGIAKVIGAIGLYYRKYWGMDILIAVTVILLPFDIFTFVKNPTLLKAIYIAINAFIALYLVNYNPKKYIEHLKQRTKKRQLK